MFLAVGGRKVWRDVCRNWQLLKNPAIWQQWGIFLCHLFLHMHHNTSICRESHEGCVAHACRVAL